MAKGLPFDETQKQRLLNELAQGSSLVYAAASIGVAISTVKRHAKDDPAFAVAINEAAQTADGKMQRRLYDEILDQKSINGMFRWLESRQSYEWGQRKLIVNEHVGPGGGPIQVAVASTDSLRELLTDPDYHQKMMSVVKELPMIEATATETP